MYFIFSRTSLKWRALLLTILTNNSITLAQQSAAGQDTLIAVIGRDYVMMGADSSSSGSGGIALLSSTSSDIDKLAVVHDGLSCTSVRRKEDDAIFALGQQAILVGCAGDAADADRLIGMLRAHAQVREFEAGIGNDAVCIFDGKSHSGKSGAIIHGTLPTSGLDCDAIAHLTRGEIASRMRSRQPLQLCLLVGGMVRCNQPEVEETMQIKQRSESFSQRVQNQVITGSQSYSKKSNGGEQLVQEQSTTPQSAEKSNYRSESKPHLVPKLFWLDQYGSLQNLRYGAHGFGSNFALSILDQRYQSDMAREEAIALIRECFQQLRQRYVINSPNKARIKCVDAFGIREVE